MGGGGGCLSWELIEKAGIFQMLISNQKFASQLKLIFQNSFTQSVRQMVVNDSFQIYAASVYPNYTIRFDIILKGLLFYLFIVVGLSQICGKSVRSATLMSVKNLQSADSRSVK